MMDYKDKPCNDGTEKLGVHIVIKITSIKT